MITQVNGLFDLLMLHEQKKKEKKKKEEKKITNIPTPPQSTA